MKTVKNIADEMGVNVQTVYRRLNEIKQGSTDKLTEKVKGITYFTEIGEQLIKDSLAPVEQLINNDKQPESELTSFFTEQIKSLQEELKTEREHSRALAERLATIIENNQKLDATQMITDGKQKRSLWSKLFRRERGGD